MSYVYLSLYISVSTFHLSYTSTFSVQFSSVQSLSRVRLFATPWIAARQASLSITISRSSLKLKYIESVMPFSHRILCRPLFLLPPIPPSIRVFSSESTLRMIWPKYGVSALASFLPKKSQGWSPSQWTGWISLQSKGLSRVFSNTTVQKHQFFGAQPSSQCNSHIHPRPQEKPSISSFKELFSEMCNSMSPAFNLLLCLFHSIVGRQIAFFPFLIFSSPRSSTPGSLLVDSFIQQVWMCRMLWRHGR